MKSLPVSYQNRIKLTVAVTILTFALVGCIESISPEQATNPVGTTHEVTITVTDSIIGKGGTYEGEWLAIFEIVDGPNTGTVSNGDCDTGEVTPTCISSGADTVSWEYLSNGQTGTDTIVACIVPLDIEELEELQSPPPAYVIPTSCGEVLIYLSPTPVGSPGAITSPPGNAGGSPTAVVPTIDPVRCIGKGDLVGFCRVAYKTWVDEGDDDHHDDKDRDKDRRKRTATPTPTQTRTPTQTPTVTPTPTKTPLPNMSGIVAPSRPIDRSGYLQAAPAQPAAPLPIVRPPSTGDAGLVED